MAALPADGIRSERRAGAARVLDLKPTALEIACNWALGCDPMQSLPASKATPLGALETAIEPALSSTPCLVSFSGGFDSSLVLSVAVRLARRLGVPDPIPITWRFTDAPKAQESEWQDLVVAELALSDWERLDAGDDLDLVGPVARRVLARHGLLYPANAFLHEPLLARASGGSLLTGIGGDQMLGTWRGSALADCIAGRRWPSVRDLRRLGRACLPRPLKTAIERTRTAGWSWLASAANRDAVRRLAHERAAEPIAWDAHLRWQLARRDHKLSEATFSRLAKDADATVLSPLLDGDFVAALAQAGGRLGFGDRRATTALLFGDVLPRALLRRPRKALFNDVFWREPTRQLTRSWAGAAIDPQLVDHSSLRAVWSSDEPTWGTALLVQQAWLGTREPFDATL